MKLIKVGAFVLGLHVVGFILIFFYPGCRSTPRAEQPASTGSEPAAPERQPAPLSSALPSAEGEANVLEPSPVSVPGAAGNDLSSSLRLPPTRPTEEQLAGIDPVTGAAPRVISGYHDYTVAKGDNFSRISKQTGVTIDEILKANNLKRSSTLRVGQVLKIPGASTATTPGSSLAPAGSSAAASSQSGSQSYTVASGDSLYTIARKLGTTVAVLKNANKLQSDRLKIGQTLVIPAGATAAAPAPTSGAPAPQVRTGLSKPAATTTTTTHTVAAGETLGAIARRYNVNAGDIMRANGISDPRKLKVGATISIPGAAAAPSTVRPAATRDAAPFSAPAISSPVAAPLPSADAAPAPAAAQPLFGPIDSSAPVPAPADKPATELPAADEGPVLQVLPAEEPARP